MKKIIFAASILLFGCSSVYSDGISSRLNLRTENGTVSAYPYQARFTNGTLTNNNDGTVSIAITGAGIGNPVTNGTSGSILFVDSNTNAGQNNSNFYWDNVNKWMGIGTNSQFQSNEEFTLKRSDGNWGAVFSNGTFPHTIFRPSTLSSVRVMNFWNFNGGEVAFIGGSTSDASADTFNLTPALGFSGVTISGDGTSSILSLAGTLNGQTQGYIANNRGITRIQASTGGYVSFDGGIGPSAPKIVTISSISVAVLVSTNSVYDVTFSTSSISYHVSISTNGHIITYGDSPSISSCGSTPNGSVVGDDNQGTITIGGGVPTSCTMTFSHTWVATPTCTSISNTTVIVDGIGSISATAVTFNFSAASGNGTFWYRCGCSGTACR